MKSSSLFIGLGIGLLVGTAIGLYIAADDEKKAEILDEIKAKAEETKKVVKQGLEELDKAVEQVNQAAKDVFSEKKDNSEPEYA